jgi:hypothetical protein
VLDDLFANPAKFRNESLVSPSEISEESPSSVARSLLSAFSILSFDLTRFARSTAESFHMPSDEVSDMVATLEHNNRQSAFSRLERTVIHNLNSKGGTAMLEPLREERTDQ